MMTLQITNTPAKFDLAIRQPQLNMTSTNSALDINSQAAVVEIHQPKGELQIDQYPCRYSIGLKNAQDFTRDFAQQGQQTANETIGRITEEGDRLMSIETKEDVVTALAVESVDIAPLDITWAQIERPTIEYRPQAVEYNPHEGKQTIHFQPGKIDHDFQWGKVELNMTQYPKVDIQAIDNSVDKKV